MSPKLKKTAPKLDSQIFLNKSKILERVSQNQVVVIIGPTGCGKSTQIPQYLYEAGFSRNGTIACLHPRCIAAMTLAERVSLETRTDLGSLVGYSVRFYSEYSRSTRIMYMTTGYMLRTLRNDSDFDKFSVIVIDEAHERSVHNDIMMGRMKMIMRKNRFIRLVIMSATLNVEEIKKFYPDCVTIEIRDNDNRVDVIYRPLKSTKYLDAIHGLVKEILGSSKTGHILVFLPSEEKVRKCKRLLKDLEKPIVLGFYSAMDYDDKMMVFKEFGRKRKVILATNIAETSLTIDAVDFVIDCGLVKRVKYDHENRLEKWVTERISMAEADQRKGRTGRTGPGKCYRLYDGPPSDDWKVSFVGSLAQMCEMYQVIEKQMRPNYPVAEIKSVNLGFVILMLKSMGITDISKFPFIVPPDDKSLKLSVTHLQELSLLNPDETVTNLGKSVTILPLDPVLGKVAVIGSELPCRREVIAMISLLSVMNIFKNPTAKESQQCHKAFASVHGDLFALLNVYEAALRYGFSKQWCTENCINYSGLKYALLIERQLQWLLPMTRYRDADLSRSKENQIKKVFLSGLFNHIAFPIDGGGHQTAATKLVTIHQHSCLRESKEIVLGTVLLQSATSKGFVLRNCVTLGNDMLKFFVPQKYKVKLRIWREIMKRVNGNFEKSDGDAVDVAMV